MIKVILTIIYVILTTSGLFMFKIGGDTLKISLSNGFNFSIGFVTLLGFLLYLGSFLLWQKLLVSFDISYIVPVTTGIVQLVVLLIGILFFKEQINWIGILGIILVIGGVILMLIGKKS